VPASVLIKAVFVPVKELRHSGACISSRITTVIQVCNEMNLVVLTHLDHD
jgi:hypothetical protein